MRSDLTHAVRALLVVLALAASLREAGAAACQSLCPWGATAAEAAAPPCDACATPDCGRDESPSGCALPCSKDVPCPLFAPAPPALVERTVVTTAAADPHHATVGSVELAPGAAFLAATVDLHPASPQRAEATSTTRPHHAAALWLLDRALLI